MNTETSQEKVTCILSGIGILFVTVWVSTGSPLNLEHLSQVSVTENIVQDVDLVSRSLLLLRGGPAKCREMQSVQ